jgi:hypothetical protein
MPQVNLPNQGGSERHVRGTDHLLANGNKAQGLAHTTTITALFAFLIYNIRGPQFIPGYWTGRRVEMRRQYKHHDHGYICDTDRT